MRTLGAALVLIILIAMLGTQAFYTVDETQFALVTRFGEVKQIATTIDEYVYTSDDDVIEGEIEEGKRYTEPDFNRIIEQEWTERVKRMDTIRDIDRNIRIIIEVMHGNICRYRPTYGDFTNSMIIIIRHIEVATDRD